MLRNVIHFFSFFKFPLLSGILIGTSYIPLPPWALFFCFIPLWYFCLKNQHNFKHLLWGGWITQFTLICIGFHWVIYTIQSFGGFHWSLASIGFLLFCSFAGLHIPIALGIWHFLLRFAPFQPQWARLLLLPTLISIGFTIFPMIFPWHLGYGWFQSYFPAFQTAEIWGFGFLSTITLFLQLCFFSKKIPRISIGLSILAVLNVGGLYLKNRIKDPTHQAKVLIVQNNIHGMTSASHQRAVRRLFSLTKRELKKQKNIDFILWPEGSYHYVIDKGSYLTRKVKRDFKTTLITGGSAQVEDQFTNSIFFIQPSGKLTPKRYDKNILLAFGEYIPGEYIFPSLKKFFLNSKVHMKRGISGPQVEEVRSIKLGLQICYEGLFDLFSKNLSEKGADIIVNITNDAWFGWWYQPYQHFYMTLARGIELRKPIIRSTKTGISAVMDAKGDIIAQSPIRKTWAQTVSVPYSKKTSPTIFEKWGYCINKIFLIFMFLLPFVIFYFKKYFKRT